MIRHLKSALSPTTKKLIKDILQLPVLLLSWLVYKLLPQKKIWIVSERGYEAQDNGYWMFRYLKKEHPEIPCYYVIRKDSEDASKLKEWKKDLLDLNSFMHYVRMWQASHIIRTHKGGFYPYRVNNSTRLMRLVERLSPKKQIWLQHGILKDDIAFYHYSKDHKLDIFVCGAKPEYDYVKEIYGFAPEVYQYTGLARFDGLHDLSVNRKQILIMPTFRWWLKGVSNSEFCESQYCQTFRELLADRRLHTLLKEYGLQLIFYPHFESQQYIQQFVKEELPDSIIIAKKGAYNVQELLKSSALLVTDFSSIFFDFAYMHKPIIYFQFDEEKYRAGHYKQGYYDYHDGLGSWTDNVEGLLDEIHQAAESGFSMPDKYVERCHAFFPLCDTNNSERIYQAILKL